MAIDSEKKRRASIAAGGDGQALPTADGTIDAGDRGVLAGGYSSSALDGGGGGGGGSGTNGALCISILEGRRRRR